jgi:uncharacterized protein (TIGR00661 family)
MGCMARIVYSLAGEGRGHATRVRAVVEHLRHAHEFTLLAPSVAYDFLSGVYAGTEVNVRRIPGLLFHYRHRRFSHRKTIVETVRYLKRLPRLINSIRRMIEDFNADLAITDFEPALPRAAQKAGLPVISVNHQHFLVSYDLSGAPAAARWRAFASSPLIKAYCLHASARVVSAFYFPPLKRAYADVIQAGVFLRPEMRRPPEDGEHLLVYLRKYAEPNVLQALAECGREVRIYGLGAKPTDGNLRYFEVSEQGFVQDLASCTALVSNAGNQLVGEALYLRKPVLAMPERGLFEQQINGYFLKAGGGGDSLPAETLDGNRLRLFLDQRDDYVSRIDPTRMDGIPTVLEVIQRHLPAVARKSSADQLSPRAEELTASDA